MSEDAAPRRAWPLVVRRAREEDRDAVFAFASRTWNDWDYVPHAWPRWLEERDGVMLVATTPVERAFAAADSDGNALRPAQPVAVVRVSIPARGEGWLEGIRVDPRVRGMDVATDLQVAELQWAAANGARIVRYATGAANEGSHRLGARGGFEHVATLRGTWWSPEGVSDPHNQPSGFLAEVQEDARRRRRALLAAAERVAEETEASALWPFVEADASFRAAQRLYEPRPWALEELTREKFEAHVRAREVLVGRSDERLAVGIMVADVAPAEDAALRLSLLTGDPPAAFDLIERLRALAGEAIRFRYADGAPLFVEVEERYRAAGYVMPDSELHILARPLDNSNPPPAVDPSAVVMEDAPEAAIVPAR